MNRIQQILERGIKGKDLAEMLGISPQQISNFKRGREIPSKRIEKLIDALFFEGRKPHPDSMIESVIQMMEDCDLDTKKNILSCAEKEKLLTELKKERQGREAA